MATRFKNGVVKYFKDNIGIIIALLAMFIFLTVFPTTKRYTSSKVLWILQITLHLLRKEFSVCSGKQILLCTPLRIW